MQDPGLYIKKVVFALHPSFNPSTRVVEAAPFEVTEMGWGEFEVRRRYSRTRTKLYSSTQFEVRARRRGGASATPVGPRPRPGPNLHPTTTSSLIRCRAVASPGAPLGAQLRSASDLRVRPPPQVGIKVFFHSSGDRALEFAHLLKRCPTSDGAPK